MQMHYGTRVTHNLRKFYAWLKWFLSPESPTIDINKDNKDLNQLISVIAVVFLFLKTVCVYKYGNNIHHIQLI